jgi:hypothetical protein
MPTKHRANAFNNGTYLFQCLYCYLSRRGYPVITESETFDVRQTPTTAFCRSRTSLLITLEASRKKNGIGPFAVVLKRAL